MIKVNFTFFTKDVTKLPNYSWELGCAFEPKIMSILPQVGDVFEVYTNDNDGHHTYLFIVAEVSKHAYLNYTGCQETATVKLKLKEFT